MKLKKEAPKLSQIDKMIANKKRLIIKLHKDVEMVQRTALKDVADIQFRIKMAQTLMDALIKGRA